MNNDKVDDFATLAALYALGHLEGEEHTAFEALLRERQGPAADRLDDFRRVAETLAWGIPPREPPPTLRERLLERVRQERQPQPDPARINLAPGILLVLAEQLAWRETGVAGIQYKPLFVDAQRRYASSLVTMAPGATYPRHRHAQTEELFLLSGDMRLDGHVLHSGDYCRAEAGTQHEPLSTETGCTFIALASLHDEFIAERPERGV